jgi:hypothetical protein
MSNSALVDTLNDDKPGNLDQLRKDLAGAAGKTRKDAKAEEDQFDDTVPEKYRGKSIEDVIEMHQNAEKKIGQTGNELGQYKMLTDQLLDLKRRDDLNKGGADVEEEEENLPKITQSEILDDPDTAIGKAIDARLSRAERKQERKEEQTEAERLQQAFTTRHPDAQAIVQDEEFQKFVTSSPSRQMLASAALNAGNLYAANVLLDEWKDIQQESNSQDEGKDSADEKDPLADARKASTLSAGQSTASNAPTGKVYNRLDLIRLKLEDPEAYGSEAFQQEIMRAYADGRVK